MKTDQTTQNTEKPASEPARSPAAACSALAGRVDEIAHELEGLNLPVRNAGAATGYGSPSYMATVYSQELQRLAQKVRRLELNRGLSDKTVP